MLSKHIFLLVQQVLVLGIEAIRAYVLCFSVSTQVGHEFQLLPMDEPQPLQQQNHNEM